MSQAGNGPELGSYCVCHWCVETCEKSRKSLLRGEACQSVPGFSGLPDCVRHECDVRVCEGTSLEV